MARRRTSSAGADTPASVRVHYTGDGQYVTGYAADPHVTLEVTEAEAAGLLETGLYAKGNAPERPAPEEEPDPAIAPLAPDYAMSERAVAIASERARADADPDPGAVPAAASLEPAPTPETAPADGADDAPDTGAGDQA